MFRKNPQKTGMNLNELWVIHCVGSDNRQHFEKIAGVMLLTQNIFGDAALIYEAAAVGENVFCLC